MLGLKAAIPNCSADRFNRFLLPILGFVRIISIKSLPSIITMFPRKLLATQAAHLSWTFGVVMFVPFAILKSIFNGIHAKSNRINNKTKILFLLFSPRRSIKNFDEMIKVKGS